MITKLLSKTRNKMKNHDKILMLDKSLLSSIETLVLQALIDMEIIHEEFIAIFKEKDKYERMEENKKNVSANQKNMRLNCVHSRSWKRKWDICPLKKISFFLCVCKIMCQIRKEVCGKCDTEIIDKGEYFWINRRVLEVDRSGI